jgi:hypothetical protein
MPDVEYSDLEIGVSRLGETRYRVQLRYWPTNDDSVRPNVFGEMSLDARDVSALGPDDYGRYLSRVLFASEDVQRQFGKAQGETFGKVDHPGGLRIRLSIEPDAQALNDFHWETLYAPGCTAGDCEQPPLSAQELAPVSRLLASWNQQRVVLRPKGDLKALVVIADAPLFDNDTQQPLDLGVNVDDEWQRARSAIKTSTPPKLLARHPDAQGLPTPDALLDELKVGHDIIYIVCHGALTNEGPFLLLESEQEGKKADLEGSRLTDRLAATTDAPLPRLIVLTACQSAGSGRSTANTAHMALGPALVRAGVPAVVAMNGEVTQTTIANFMPTFFENLFAHGFVDRAMAGARSTVRGPGTDDWWMPVLFMRLQSGRIWSVPYLSARDQEPYEELKQSLLNEQCTPVVGPALLERLWGSPRQVARQWAADRGSLSRPINGTTFHRWRNMSGAANRAGPTKRSCATPGLEPWRICSRRSTRTWPTASTVWQVWSRKHA